MATDLLLLETLNQDRHHQLRAEYFPLLAGLGAELGWETAWLTLVIDPDAMHKEERFRASLTRSQQEALAAELSARAPRVLVVHERPGAGLQELLSRCAPEARVVDLTREHTLRGRRDRLGPDATLGELLELVGAGEEHPRDAEVAADVLPFVYSRRVIGEHDIDVDAHPVRLLLNPACWYRKPVRTNPLYRDLAGPAVEEHLGCSFCPKAMGRFVPKDRGAAALDRALRQVEAHQAATKRERYRYFFEDAAFNADLSRLLDGAVERGLGPSIFTTMLRADTLLAQREALERALPGARDDGHALRLMSVGAESFSGDENRRFNKGLSSDDLWACFDMIRDLEARFPQAFSCTDPGIFATILFTPWSTPDDILTNVRAARRLGVEFLKKAAGTRLQLTPGLPITELAAHDGLLCAGEGEARDIRDASLWNVDMRDLAWRFKDARSERICQLVVRLEPIAEQVVLAEDDPLFVELRAARATLPPSLRGDYVAVAEALVEAVIALGPAAGVFELMAHAAIVAVPTGHSAPAPAAAREPAAAPRPDAGWADAIAERLAAESPAWLAGYELTDHDLREERGCPQLHLRFEGPRGSLALCIEDADSGNPAWQRSERYSARYSGDLPAAARSEEELTRRLLAWLEQVLDAPISGAS